MAIASLLSISMLACAENPGQAAALVTAPSGCEPQKADRGQSLFSQCAICHQIDPERGNATGPNLAHVYGRTVGGVEGFKYSPALRNSSEAWTAEHLDAFLASPGTTYPGMRMAFAGIPDPEDRASLICFLASKRTTQ